MSNPGRAKVVSCVHEYFAKNYNDLKSALPFCCQPFFHTCRIDKDKGEKRYHQKTAQKLLAVMQSEVENGTFYLEKFITKGFSDVISFIENWLKIREDDFSPATYKGYKSYVKNHIKPYFKKHSHLSLHDIQIDNLRALKSSLKNSQGASLPP